ncbi:methyltransferase domain-containing protein [Nonomuraea sp. NPDC050643]|uniref:class I SAM-dependent methyltransferase n=1 Tax=Nonomuraea sp. NPDC050643 TaxID=3155660 RepID=UPI0033D46F37
MHKATAYHDEFGDFFAQHAGTSPYNAYIDRPAMLRLAGDVAGDRILDVGCGAGHYAAELLARGAEVVGVDGSATLLGHARDRVNGRAELHLHDLESPLRFAADASFDGVICALVFQHVRDVLGAGFVLERLIEPRPVDDLRDVDEASYDRLSQAPSFLAARLRRP